MQALLDRLKISGPASFAHPCVGSHLARDAGKASLSGILNRYQAAGNQKALELLKRISPVAWQHIHFLGHYAFRDTQHPIDLEAILACVNLQ
jgi:hypothetical protein